MKKMVSLLLLVVFVLSLAPMTTFAGPRVLPYKDVVRIDKQSSEAISFVKRHNGWKGLIKKGRFRPNKYMTRREFLVCLHNLYGEIVTADMSDVLLANKPVTSEFVCERLAKLSKPLGFPITWSGYKKKMKRKEVARYIMIFATFNPSLMPRK